MENYPYLNIENENSLEIIVLVEASFIETVKAVILKYKEVYVAHC